MDKNGFMKLLEENPELKADLFIRGCLVSDRKNLNTADFPFYGNWREEVHCGYCFLAHKLAGLHVYEFGRQSCVFLLGHAYNPFTMQHDELPILQRIADAYGTNQWFDRISEITGVFIFGVIADRGLQFLVDPSGMQSACYGVVNGSLYLSTHPQLIGDLCGLEMDAFVKKLVAYKWYGRVMGPYLPADLTPFSAVKRVVPSINYAYNGAISHKRYWPLKAQTIAETPADYEQVIQEAADILRSNMEMICRKWQHPWISLTGGIDSNTTFASGVGNYDKLETFSYISAEKEVPDAEAAQKIADHFGIRHHVYHIPEDNSALPLFEARRELFRHNNGYVAELYDNEARKKLYLRDHAGCDVEVKSWVSETIRAYWYKHYGRKRFPKLSGKLYRNLYKIFLTDRSLAHEIDRLFEDYIRDFEYDRIPACYPPADMHYNEVTWGSWGGLNITEMKYCFDITFVYNNRRFLDLMFRVPLEKRISDQHHLDMKRYLNPELADMNIRVVNMKETGFRAFALNMIFTFNSLLP